MIYLTMILADGQSLSMAWEDGELFFPSLGMKWCDVTKEMFDVLCKCSEGYKAVVREY